MIYVAPTVTTANQKRTEDARVIDDEKRLEIGPQISVGNTKSNTLAESSGIQLFLRKKTMDTTQPLLTVFKKLEAQTTVQVPPTSGQELNRFDWLLFRPQAHAVRPFETDRSARVDKYKNTK
jgi:hypothetical protein